MYNCIYTVEFHIHIYRPSSLYVYCMVGALLKMLRDITNTALKVEMLSCTLLGQNPTLK